MNITERLKLLRSEMKKEQIDVYYIPTADYHQSEYVSEFFQTRKYISGFTGSAGSVVVTLEDAALFTDGRYFVQAEKELAGSNIRLMKMGMEGVPELKDYIDSKMSDNKVLGFDGKVVSLKQGNYFSSKYQVKGQDDLVGKIWENRPALPFSKVWILEEKYTGESCKSKLSRVREAMQKEHCDYHIISSLDDIAWLFNIRGNDVCDNPVVLAYAVVGKENTVLFADLQKFDVTAKKYLEENQVDLKDYDEIYSYVNAIPQNAKIMLDEMRTNYAMELALPEECEIVYKENPTILMKAIKNPVEVENERNAHIKDGVAVTKFIYWLKNTIGKEKISEVDAAEKLEEFRKAQEGYIEPSFETISAYNVNGAMMHYSARRGAESVLEASGTLLVDSGGQYYEGTTDVTRTIGLGNVTDEFRLHYTAALKGMLNLSNAKFLKGCTGRNLDILARGPVWDLDLDYRCGTGHGVGYLLNVHEAPNAFRWKADAGCVLEPGMITSNEPGVYIEGAYGIRIENEIVVKQGVQNEYGQFLEFETLTMVPIDMELINFDYMELKDKKRLMSYQKLVYDKLEKYLLEEEKNWYKKMFLKNLL